MANKTHYAEGTYVAEVKAQALSKTSKGNFQIVLQIKILGLVDNNDAESYTEVKTQYVRTVYMVVTDNTIDFVVSALEKLGYDGESFSAIDPGHPNHFSLVGKTADFYCQHKVSEKDGNTYENWGVSRGEQVLKVVPPLEDREARRLDALFGKALKGRGKKAAPAAEDVQDDFVQDPILITDDDIPF